MRTLLISNIYPLPLTNGGNQRTYHLMEALRTVGDTDLLLVPRYDAANEQLLAQMRDRWGTVEIAPTFRRGEILPWKLIRPLSPGSVDRAANAIGDRGFYYRPDPAASSAMQAMIARRRYDAVVARYAQSAGVSGIAQSGRPVIIDIDDLDTHVVRTNLLRAHGQPVKEWIFRRQLRQLNNALPPLLSSANHCWVTTPEDGAAVKTGRFSVLPNIPVVELGKTVGTGAASKRILLVGSMYFRPNAEGAKFFVERVWPSVRTAHPTAEFRIVGSGLDESLAARWRDIPGVTVAGFAETLAAEYEACAFSVVPILAGGGTKIKVLEALSYGRTCVVASHAHRGYEGLRHGASLLVAESAEAFARHCICLLENVPERLAMASHGRVVVETIYSVSRFNEIVKRDVMAVVSAAKHPQSSGVA